MGSPVGPPGEVDQQLQVLRDTLSLLETATKPGTICQLDHRWRP